VGGITIYVLATLLVLITFARRIRQYSTENGLFIKTYLKLLYRHLFIFIPPVAYMISNIPYTILTNLKISSSFLLSMWYLNGRIYSKNLDRNTDRHTDCYHMVTLCLFIESLYERILSEHMVRTMVS
jgi:hypothetical protein